MTSSTCPANVWTTSITPKRSIIYDVHNWQIVTRKEDGYEAGL